MKSFLPFFLIITFLANYSAFASCPSKTSDDIIDSHAQRWAYKVIKETTPEDQLFIANAFYLQIKINREQLPALYSMQKFIKIMQTICESEFGGIEAENYSQKAVEEALASHFKLIANIKALLAAKANSMTYHWPSQKDRALLCGSLINRAESEIENFVQYDNQELDSLMYNLSGELALEGKGLNANADKLFYIAHNGIALSEEEKNSPENIVVASELSPLFSSEEVALAKAKNSILESITFFTWEQAWRLLKITDNTSQYRVKKEAECAKIRELYYTELLTQMEAKKSQKGFPCLMFDENGLIPEALRNEKLPNNFCAARNKKKTSLPRLFVP